MNYFELYKLPISFHPDPNLVKQQFYALSKKYHPDFFINESAAKQNEVLELSTLNNKAFQVLKDPSKVLAYVLQLKGMVTEGESYALPQSFLMEMMEVNETIMDLQFDPDEVKVKAVKDEIQEIEQDLSQKLRQLTLQFDAATATQQELLLNAIKDIYYRNKYIVRLKESLTKLSS